MTLQVNSIAINEVYFNHNVGYTVVDGGSISIVNGIASGFSDNDYLRLSGDFSTAKPFEIVLKIKFSTASRTEYIFAAAGMYIYLSDTRRIAMQVQNSSSSWVYASTNNALNANQYWYIKFVYNGSNIACYFSEDGETWQSGTSAESVLYSRNIRPTLGTRTGSSFAAFSGSINLNDSYIKQDGITVFNGKETARSTVNEVYYNKNCGYTIVGNPTISDGIVSGFSANDYVELQNSTNSINSLNLITKITTASATNVYRFILGVKKTRELTIAQGSNKKLRLQLGNTGTAYYTELSGLTELQPNTTYYIKVEYSNSNFTMYLSLDGSTWTNEGSITYNLNAITLRFGVTWSSSTYYWRGTIDLNETYIKVNGVKFFNGKQAASNAVWTRPV